MYHRQQHGEFNYETPYFLCVRVLFIEKFIFDERSSKFKVKTRGNRMQQSGASQRGDVGSLQKKQQLRQQSNVFGIPGTLCVNRSEQCLRQGQK